MRIERDFQKLGPGHVIMRRKLVTPWFFVRLKPKEFVLKRNVPFCIFGIMGTCSVWTHRGEHINEFNKPKLVSALNKANESPSPKVVPFKKVGD